MSSLGELLRAKLANEVFKSDLQIAKEQFEIESMKMQANIAQMRNAQSSMAMGAAMQNAAIGGTGLYGSGLNQAAMQNNIYAAQPQGEPFDPNNEPAYQMELSALCDLWHAKHGDKWVNSTHEDPFWIDAVERLGSAGKLETKRGWMRLKA